ncbi:hypothetical protein N7461_005480 [Penicillium sp. DV-2018c]|nr:hypothetical protein N7461_005480 [Penicillium sp. DV-2018c]
MARSTARTSGRPSILLLLALMASIGPGRAFDTISLLPRGSDICPSSYTRCSNTKLPNNFCCPPDSTCISLDEASSAICCPAGQDCDYISPIICDIQQQNATLYAQSAIKTTRLNDTLPKCGDACCPFGYTCQGKTCVRTKKASTTSTASSTSTTSPTTTRTGATTPLTTITPVSSSSERCTIPTASANLTTSCPSFPAGAVATGFFPGAVFGTIAALLISLCLGRRRKNGPEIQEGKPRPHWSQRSSSGTVINISNPIPQEDTSYRTDFLRSPQKAKRSSIGGRSTRSMIRSTGTRVRSLFSGYPRHDTRLYGDVPPVPMPMPPDPFTPPRQRQLSTESIKVYSPPGVFSQSRSALRPEPYPRSMARPETTFSDLMNVAGLPPGRKGAVPYSTSEESRENPFRDPGR